jgi:hypothetical protein
MLSSLSTLPIEFKHALIIIICSGLVCLICCISCYDPTSSLLDVSFDIQPVGTPSFASFLGSPGSAPHSVDASGSSTHVWHFICCCLDVRCILVVSRDFDFSLPRLAVSPSGKISRTITLQTFQTLVHCDRYGWETASLLFRAPPTLR